MSFTVSVPQNEKEQGTRCGLEELARVTGIQETDLSRYQELGLFSASSNPSGRGDGYTRGHLIQLERISFMNLLGMSTAQIKDALGTEVDLANELRLQQEILQQIRRQLDHLTYFLQITEELNRRPRADDWHYMSNAIELLEQLNHMDVYTTRYIVQSSTASAATQAKT